MRVINRSLVKRFACKILLILRGAKILFLILKMFYLLWNIFHCYRSKFYTSNHNFNTLSIRTSYIILLFGRTINSIRGREVLLIALPLIFVTWDSIRVHLFEIQNDTKTFASIYHRQPIYYLRDSIVSNVTANVPTSSLSPFLNLSQFSLNRSRNKRDFFQTTRTQRRGMEKMKIKKDKQVTISKERRDLDRDTFSRTVAGG